jgi:hypothetical protein
MSVHPKKKNRKKTCDNSTFEVNVLVNGALQT